MTAVLNKSALITRRNRQMRVGEGGGGARLTLSFRDRAADGGAGGGDGAHGRTHAISRVDPGHSSSVGNPCSWVNGPDRLTC